MDIKIIILCAILLNIQVGAGEPNCTTGGQFLDNNVPDCLGFVLCTEIMANTFMKNIFKCPETFHFNPLTQQCSNSTNFLCFNDVLDFNCSNLGSFENNNDDSCSSFIGCYKTLDNKISPMLFNCMKDLVYSPSNGECVNKSDYICPRLIIFEDTNNNTSTTTTTNNRSSETYEVTMFATVIFALLGLMLN